jgi:hypothetical protein
MGRDFDTWLIPAMRIIVDFSLDEPMFGVTAPVVGQPRPTSTMPSPAGARGNTFPSLQAWLSGPQYRKVLALTPGR